MLSENIILQSAGSLSVAVLALLMLILQTLFFFRKPQFTWYAWGAATSFSAFLYSVGIFLEYNTPQGPLNRFSGLLEFTAIICLIHCLYGFTFSYLGIESKRYHPIAGVCHSLILILLWSTHYFVAENFTTWNFINLKSPYTEPALGPLGPLFELYAAIASVNAMIIWIRHKRTHPKYRIIYLSGMGFWILLGIHDGLASLGVPTLQYFMEYGFLGFAMAVLWVVFNSHLEIAAEEKYRVITEFANDCILVIQDGKMVFGNPACCDLIAHPLSDSAPRDFLDIMDSKDRKMVLKHYNALLEGGCVPNPHTIGIRSEVGEQRFVEIAASLIQYRDRPAVLAVLRDTTERKQAEEKMQESEKNYRHLVENISDVIYSIDTDGVMTYISPAIESISGYSPSEIIGKPLFEFIYKEDLPLTRKRFEESLSSHTKPNEYRMVDKFGEIHWILASSKPISAQNHIIGIQGVLTDITERKQAELALRENKQKLEQQAQRLKDVNTALNVLLEHKQEEKKKIEENILSNVQKLIFPYIEKLESSQINDKNQTYIDNIKSNLKELISPFANTLSSKYAILTSTEIQVADHIKHGRSSKEIASLLNVSIKAVSFHRANIRRKLGLSNKKINLRSHLQSLST